MTDYTKIDQEVDAVGDLIWDMASNVWEFAELSYEELQSSAYECEALEKNGFTISDRGIGGLDTSWIATWGSGSPVLHAPGRRDALRRRHPGTRHRAAAARAPLRRLAPSELGRRTRRDRRAARPRARRLATHRAPCRRKRSPAPLKRDLASPSFPPWPPITP